MSYSPSEAAVEVMARVRYDQHRRDIYADNWPEWHDLDARTQDSYRVNAAEQLVVLMGATVPAEPCAMCGGSGTIPVKRVRGRVAVTVDETCRWCPSPRSLPVVECEAAGLLERKGAIPPYYDGVLDVDVPAEPLFFGAAPSTGREPKP